MFYDYVAFRTVIETTTNEIGQDIEVITPTDTFLCDIQPLQEGLIDVSWGKDIKGSLTLYADVLIGVGEYVIVADDIGYKGTYKVKDRKVWSDYTIYLLEGYNEQINR